MLHKPQFSVAVDDFGYLAVGKNRLLGYKGLAGLVKAADSSYNIGTLLDIKFVISPAFFYQKKRSRKNKNHMRRLYVRLRAA